MKFKYLILTALLVISCDSFFENENNAEEVRAFISDEDLVIRNDLPIDIYYFAIDQASLPYVDWFPDVGDYNRIDSRSSIVKDVKELFSYKAGETVVVYYWDENITKIHSIIID